MGALHQGHASLIRASAAAYDATIISIFVNPLQFGPREDFRHYPRTLARDVHLAKAAGADLVFAPSAEEMYPQGFQTWVDVGSLGARWEGKSRPGHFRGVATIVAKLFNLVRPTHAVFGQKDYQQVLIIQQLIRDLDLGIVLQVVPTVREPDGLAMSSRNRSLSASSRRQAVVLYRALCEGRTQIDAGQRRTALIVRHMRRCLNAQPGVHPDYLAVVDARTLIPRRRLHGRMALLVAARVGRTRLIDNLLVDVP